MNSSLNAYPRLFAEKLEANSKVRSAVDSSLSAVRDILQVSKLSFFPDYTDHGMQHLATLLEIAEKLIADRTRDLITPEDAAVLIFSVLLHDLALHISEAGFASLVNPKANGTILGTNHWRELWDEFLTIAKHWDDHTLVDLFGADEAGVPRALVRDPFDHYDNLTESDRKLIGEFIRRHHADFAYQFAVQGIPGKDGQLIRFDSFDSELQQLAGIIARSHGFSLRNSIRLLKEKQFNILEHENIHPVFLMGVLRIADFLELGKDRAPLIAFAYKEFKSPVSAKEWRTNQEFRKISWGNPDPGSIFIPARPTNVYSFLELKRWLAAIQHELDTTWAVFGEVYGAHPKFSQFDLSIRRVRSNIIDDSQEFENSASFVPRRVELGVAGPEVLKLLIEPLYGQHPEIGIRELVQNAVDAVRERWEFTKNHPEFVDLPLATQEGDVVVWLDDPTEDGSAVLTVSDNGIGMTDDILINYFLKAGASFRRSLAWRKEFEEENDSSSQKQFKSKVLRSGRFGIGVLAAFLLGDEIEVSTRHITSNRGIRFSMRLDLQPPALELIPIQLNYANELPVGTTLKMRVNKVKHARVEKTRRSTFIFDQDIFNDPHLWDWYCIASPSVVRAQGNRKKPLQQSVLVPAEEESLPRPWHRLPSSDYRTVHVRVRGRFPSYGPGLVCNGIAVRAATSPGFLLQKSPWYDSFPKQPVFSVRMPDFSIFDPDGNLPLNLQRTEITNTQLDFMPAAFLAQTKALFARLLTSTPTKRELTQELFDGLSDIVDFEHVIPLLFTKSGIALLTTTNLRLVAVKTCLLVNIEAFAQEWLGHVSDRYGAIIVARWGRHSSSPLYGLNEINSWVASARVITRSKEEPTVGKPLKFRYKQYSVGAFYVYRSANCPASLFDQKDVEILRDRFLAAKDGKLVRSTEDFIAAELFLKQDILSTPEPQVSVGHYWQEIINAPAIPFDQSQRQHELKHAYDNLSEFLADFSDTLETKKDAGDRNVP